MIESQNAHAPSFTDIISRISARSIIDMPPPPCEKFGCEKHDECKHQKKACEAFHWYVNNGRTVHPFTSFTNRKASMRSYVKPTEARYKKIFSEDDEA